MTGSVHFNIDEKNRIRNQCISYNYVDIINEYKYITYVYCLTICTNNYKLTVYYIELDTCVFILRL